MNKPASKPPVKAFAFRCKWLTAASEPDGYSYAVDKRHLSEEISRRFRVCKDRPIEMHIVPITVEFSKLIEAQKAKVYSTVLDKHIEDMEDKENAGTGA